MIDSFTGKFRFLSNFHLCDINYEGSVYPSSENAYQAAKTIQLDLRIPFTNYTAVDAKREGYKIPLRSDWESIKLQVMEDILTLKFTGELAQRLIATHPKQLVEGNTWGDDYWGVYKGKGCNHLGVILMRVRDNLINKG